MVWWLILSEKIKHVQVEHRKQFVHKIQFPMLEIYTQEMQRQLDAIMKKKTKDHKELIQLCRLISSAEYVIRVFKEWSTSTVTLPNDDFTA